jgi:hypothetical protein
MTARHQYKDWLHELSIDMFPQDGRLQVYGIGEDGVTDEYEIIPFNYIVDVIHRACIGRQRG